MAAAVSQAGTGPVSWFQLELNSSCSPLVLRTLCKHKVKEGEEGQAGGRAVEVQVVGRMCALDSANAVYGLRKSLTPLITLVSFQLSGRGPVVRGGKR